MDLDCIYLQKLLHCQFKDELLRMKTAGFFSKVTECLFNVNLKVIFYEFKNTISVISRDRILKDISYFQIYVNENKFGPFCKSQLVCISAIKMIIYVYIKMNLIVNDTLKVTIYSCTIKTVQIYFYILVTL